LLPDGASVVTDELSSDPNPWRGFLSCLQDPPPEATHLLVIQDDAVPCANFATAVERAVADKPENVLSLFVGGLRNRTRRDFHLALKNRQRWMPVYFRDIHHVVCTVWPVALAVSFLEWTEKAKIPGARPIRSDDMVVGFWARTTRNHVWATVPCLVEHPDDVPSLIRRNTGDSGRKAVMFVGDGDLWA
jgi:hypothetical protein